MKTLKDIPHGKKKHKPEIALNHKFTKICYDPVLLLDGVNNMSSFMKALEAQAASKPHRWSYNDYVGAGFEAFVECMFLHAHAGADARLDMISYAPFDGADMGIDGEGIAMDGKRHCVQCKYRSNTTKILTANEDHLSNFVATALAKHPGEHPHLTIVSTADKIHDAVQKEMYHGRVKFLGIKELKSLVDNNKMFWNSFRYAMRKKK